MNISLVISAFLFRKSSYHGNQQFSWYFSQVLQVLILVQKFRLQIAYFIYAGCISNLINLHNLEACKLVAVIICPA